MCGGVRIRDQALSYWLTVRVVGRTKVVLKDAVRRDSVEPHLVIGFVAHKLRAFIAISN